MTRKILFAIDLLFCLAVAIFTWHNALIRYPFEIWAVLFMLLLRANATVMLYRHEKRSVWPVLLFALIFIVYGIQHFREAVAAMVEIGINIIASEEQLQLYYDNNWLTRNQVNLMKLFIFAWLLLFPIASMAFQAVRKKYSQNLATWPETFGTYLFKDLIGRKYLPIAALIAVAALMGICMAQPWLCITVLPALTYYYFNKNMHRKAHIVEYVALIIAMELLYYSQYTVNEKKVALMVGSTLVMGFLSIRVWKNSRNLVGALATFLTCGFVVPLLTLGYNYYTGINTIRCAKYYDKYVNTGLLFISDGDKYGLRDRYRILIQPQYEDYNVIDANQRFLKMTNDEGSIIYDVTTRMSTTEEIAKYGIRNVSYNDSTREGELITNNYDHIYTKMGFAPQNQRIIIENQQGKPLVYAGTASECGIYNFVKHLYGKDGKLIGLLRYPSDEAEDTPNGEEIFRLDEELGTKELLDEELLYKLVFDTDWKDKCFTRFIFKYNSKGQIIKVFDPLTNEEIVSSSNTHIEYYIREDDNFWASDLDGGHVKLTFFVVSDNTAEKKTYSMYYGYQEQ